MAYDKIITLHGRMDHCIDYVLNEEKTGLAAALAYAENPDKTHQLVTGINCYPDTALSDMRATKRRWDKKGGVLGYHIIHERIKAQADKVVYTAQQYTPGCMHRRNRHLVDNSGVCVCYLTKNSGGTAYTVNYAKKQGVNVFNIAENIKL